MQQLVGTARRFAKVGQIHTIFRDTRYDFLLFIGRIETSCLPELYFTLNLKPLPSLTLVF